MKKLSKAARAGKTFRKIQGIMLIAFPLYFIVRILLSVFLNI